MRPANRPTVHFGEKNDSTPPTSPYQAKYASSAPEFYLKEYEYLRREIEWLLKDYRALERNVVIAVGITWGWLLAQRQLIPDWAWWVPFLFSALGAIRATGILHTFGVFAQYLSRLEESFSCSDDPGGWEHFAPGKIATARTAVLFWTILIAATVAVAIYGPGIGKSMIRVPSVP